MKITRWDEEEKKEHGINVEKIIPNDKELNIERLMKFLMDKHEAGTYYSNAYFVGLKKVMASKSGKIGSIE